MMRKKVILIIGLIFLICLVFGGTYAYWTWNSTTNKSVVFNTASNISDYIVYDEGSSYFVGDFKPTDSYCQGVKTTISFNKKSDTPSNVALSATINMDVNSIGNNIANSSDVYWVVTKGDGNISCNDGLSGSLVLGSGTFFGKVEEESFSLVSDIEVTTTLEKYTVWIWINKNGTDLSKLSGETVDTNVWTQIDMVDPDSSNDIENNKDIYTITYNVNGGINGPSNQDVEVGQNAIISSVEPTRVGYTFSGWNTIANGSGTSYTAGATYNKNVDIILYAVWTPNTYMITYNSNGGTGTMSNTSCSYGKSCTLRNNSFTNIGHTFVGWTDVQDSTNIVYKNVDTVLLYNKTENTTLYAVWEISKYTISYDANNGIEEPKDQIKTYGETITLSEEIPTRNKHAFVEWNTKADGSGTSYQPGDEYIIEEGVTLYAMWRFSLDTIISYEANMFSTTNQTVNGATISYDDSTSYLTLNGSQTSGIDLLKLTNYSFEEGEQYKLELTYVSGNIVVNDTNSFGLEVKSNESGSWVSTRNYVSVQYPASGSNSAILTVNEAAALEGTVFHVWTWQNSSGAVEFDNYVVKVSITKIESISLTEDSNYVLPSYTPVRLGYTFKGWYTAESGGTQITNGTKLINNSNHTIYAQWTLNKVKINYNVDGGTITASTTSSGGTVYNWTTESDGTIKLNGTVHTQTINYGNKANLNNYNNSEYIKITKTGYSAPDGAEWICMSGCTANKTYDHDVNYSSSEFCDASNGDCTIEVKVNWKPNTYMISYNANGGSGAPASQTKTYGQTLTLSTTVPTRSGYTFKGWATSSTATSATYAAGASYTANADATLYAVWQINTLWLYNAGDQYTSVTGGWSTVNASTWYYAPTITYGTSDIYINASNTSTQAKYAVVMTKNKIDVTNYSKVYIYVSSMTYSGPYIYAALGLYTARNTDSDTSIRPYDKDIAKVSAGLYYIDVSSVTGSYYVGVGTGCDNDTSTISYARTKFTQVYLS